jgi:hypothetical protein
MYCLANCWQISENDDADNNDEFNIGLHHFEQKQNNMKIELKFVEENLPHESGDYRFDGCNAIDTVVGSIDMAVLLQQHDEAIGGVDKYHIGTFTVKPSDIWEIFNSDDDAQAYIVQSN